MDIDFDQLKRQWADQTARIERLEAQNERLRQKLSASSNITLRDKLVRSYRIFFLVALIMIPSVSIMFPSCDFPTTLTVVFISIFALEAIGNAYLLWLLSRLDFTEISTHTALRRVIHFQHTRSLIQFVAICIIVPALAYAFYVFGSIDRSIVWGGVSGGILGGIIGLLKDRDIRRTLKAMRKTLEDMDSGDNLER